MIDAPSEKKEDRAPEAANTKKPDPMLARYKVKIDLIELIKILGKPN